MLAPATELYLIVFGCNFGVSTQIVAERQMSCDFRRAVRVAMELDNSASRFIGFRAVAPSRQAQFSPSFVTERFNLALASVQRRKTANDRHEVQNRLGVNARYRR